MWDFCFPAPESLTTVSSGEPLSQPSRRLMGSVVAVHFLFREPVRVIRFPASAQHLRFREVKWFPQGHRASFGAHSQETPIAPPFLSAVWVTFPLLECQPSWAPVLEPGAHMAAFLRLLGSRPCKPD